MAKCTFLGLGVMGYPMAGHLAKAGHDVTVWNRTASKSLKWEAEYNGKQHSDITKSVQGADFVLICVGDDSDVYAVIEPAIDALDPNTIIIDHTTASSECARKCHEMAKAKSIGFIDAPISGGEAGAVNGQLTIMCGGGLIDFEKANPIMGTYAKATKHMGPSGAGQLTKMVNQICIAGILQGLAEGIHFAQKAGLNVDEVVGAIGKGAAQSWQMDNRASTMAKDEYDFGFAVDWMRKDLGIALKTAKGVSAKLMLTEMVDGYYAEVQKMGGQRWDTSSLLKRLR